MFVVYAQPCGAASPRSDVGGRPPCNGLIAPLPSRRPSAMKGADIVGMLTAPSCGVTLVAHTPITSRWAWPARAQDVLSTRVALRNYAVYSEDGTPSRGFPSGTTPSRSITARMVAPDTTRLVPLLLVRRRGGAQCMTLPLIVAPTPPELVPRVLWDAATQPRLPFWSDGNPPRQWPSPRWLTA